MRNHLQEIVAWHAGHKSRAVQIGCDDGYGASCWEVILFGHGKKLTCQEVFFLRGYSGEVPSKPGVYQHAVDESGDMDDWPGLEKVIELALEKAALYGL